MLTFRHWYSSIKDFDLTSSLAISVLHCSSFRSVKSRLEYLLLTMSDSRAKYPISINRKTELKDWLDNLSNPILCNIVLRVGLTSGYWFPDSFWVDRYLQEGFQWVALPCGHVFPKPYLETRFLQEGYHEENQCQICRFRLFIPSTTLTPWHKFPVALNEESDRDAFIKSLMRVDPVEVHAKGGTCDFCLHVFGVRDWYV